MWRLCLAVLLTPACCAPTCGQNVVSQPAARSSSSSEPIPLILPAGTPLQVALDKEVRIREVGQPIRGKIVEPAYAFDKLVVPVGSEVLGKISAIKPVSRRKRTLAALNANLSPPHEVQFELNELVLPDGRHVSLRTEVSPRSQGVLQFTTASSPEKEKQKRLKDFPGEKTREIKQEINRDWEAAKKQIEEPGKVHRLERFTLAQLPYHPQYLEAGMRLNAELREPLDFGNEVLDPDAISSVGSPPPAGSVVHTLLLSPLDSASTKKGALVEAVVTEPLSVSGHLILPEGSLLQGSVLQVRPARRFRRNGQLRIVFHQVVPPGGSQRRVEASLEGVEAGKSQHLRLDSEGGAEVTTPKTRYMTTAISVALAATSFRADTERGVVDAGGDTAGRAANGGSGFRFVGLLMGTLVHSRALASGFGVYGAATSVYSHFLAPGRNVVYPKDTAMAIGFGTRASRPTEPPKSTISPMDLLPPDILIWP